MSYQALARKWRPRSFDTIVGQEHVVRALVNAFDRDRLHHAYLFSGTRGVGKTTIARVFAKGLNCEQGPAARPCGECGACREIDEGRHVDLIEVDAASRARVEETRDLLDNVQYAPMRARFKVYLIDEVHMFSRHSFNALLKTLEEPPPHVKFLLATTDPQRLPVTVLSRCLQFGLRRLGVEEISGELARIAREEAIEADAAALRVLGRAADGSMRDALSLLDQAAAYGAGRIVASDVRALVGTVERERLFALLEGAGRLRHGRHDRGPGPPGRGSGGFRDAPRRGGRDPRADGRPSGRARGPRRRRGRRRPAGARGPDHPGSPAAPLSNRNHGPARPSLRAAPRAPGSR